MVTVETSVSQITGLAEFNVYDSAVLASSYSYDNNTQITNITPIANDLTMPLNDYIKNVAILERWIQNLQLSFLLVGGNQMSTSRNYDYDFTNHFRRATFLIDGNQFKVRYNYNTNNIVVKARSGFVFNFSQLNYFMKCHKDFYLRNDLF